MSLKLSETELQSFGRVYPGTMTSTYWFANDVDESQIAAAMSITPVDIACRLKNEME